MLAVGAVALVEDPLLRCRDHSQPAVLQPMPSFQRIAHRCNLPLDGLVRGVAQDQGRQLESVLRRLPERLKGFVPMWDSRLLVIVVEVSRLLLQSPAEQLDEGGAVDGARHLAAVDQPEQSRMPTRVELLGSLVGAEEATQAHLLSLDPKATCVPQVVCDLSKRTGVAQVGLAPSTVGDDGRGEVSQQGVVVRVLHHVIQELQQGLPRLHKPTRLVPTSVAQVEDDNHEQLEAVEVRGAERKLHIVPTTMARGVRNDDVRRQVPPEETNCADSVRPLVCCEPQDRHVERLLEHLLLGVDIALEAATGRHLQHVLDAQEPLVGLVPVLHTLRWLLGVLLCATAIGAQPCRCRPLPSRPEFLRRPGLADGHLQVAPVVPQCLGLVVAGLSGKESGPETVTLGIGGGGGGR